MKREPDYYIRNNQNILLFESKDFYIQGKIKLSYDFNLIETELKNDRLDKAVKQLLKNVERVLLKDMILDTEYEPNEVIIYPVIIVHDSLYSASALNYWVNYWFEDGLLDVKQRASFKKGDFSKILPITIVEIDTLILYEENFRNGDILLEHFISSYHDFVQFRKSDFNNSEEIEKHAFDSAISFDEFLKNECFKMGVVPDRKILFQMLNSYGII